MLSILIPVYNLEVRQLVKGLHSQCATTKHQFEILCFDDASSSKFQVLNREISALPNVRYEELSTNSGRSAIRNKLAKAARFEYLLFMDCDSKLCSDDFIQNYLAQARSGQVVCGGRTYTPEPPAEKELYLHWKYGINREQKKAIERKKAPWNSFMTNNFMIPEDIMRSIEFDESLTQYGHEDTLFGLELSKRHIPVIHIENPLEHCGLETTEVFLDKSEKAIQNLWQLYKNGDPIQTKLLELYTMLRKIGLTLPLYILFETIKGLIERNLKSQDPNLWLFDFYKLGYFASLKYT